MTQCQKNKSPCRISFLHGLSLRHLSDRSERELLVKLSQLTCRFSRRTLSRPWNSTTTSSGPGGSCAGASSWSHSAERVRACLPPWRRPRTRRRCRWPSGTPGRPCRGLVFNPPKTCFISSSPVAPMPFLLAELERNGINRRPEPPWLVSPAAYSPNLGSKVYNTL